MLIDDGGRVYPLKRPDFVLGLVGDAFVWLDAGDAAAVAMTFGRDVAATAAARRRPSATSPQRQPWDGGGSDTPDDGPDTPWASEELEVGDDVSFQLHYPLWVNLVFTTELTDKCCGWQVCGRPGCLRCYGVPQSPLFEDLARRDFESDEISERLRPMLRAAKRGRRLRSPLEPVQRPTLLCVGILPSSRFTHAADLFVATSCADSTAALYV